MTMKRVLFAAIAAASMLAMAPAVAADLSVKAPAYSLPTYPVGSGWFYGVGASGLGGTAGGDVTGGAIFGGTLSASVGYTGVIGSGFWFVDQMVKVTAINGASSALTLKESTEFETRFAYGAPASVLAQWVNLMNLGSASMPSLPGLPANLSIGPANPYAFVSVHGADVSAQVMTGFGTSWLFSWGAGIGNLYRISNGMVLDTSVEYVHQSTGLVAGALGQTVQFNDKYEAMVSLKF